MAVAFDVVIAWHQHQTKLAFDLRNGKSMSKNNSQIVLAFGFSVVHGFSFSGKTYHRLEELAVWTVQ